MNETEIKSVAAEIFKTVVKDLKERRALLRMDEEDAFQAVYENEKAIASILKRILDAERDQQATVSKEE